MKLDDLRIVWSKEVESEVSDSSISNVLSMIESETGKMDKTIRRRDLLETTTALFLLPVWFWKLFDSPSMISTLGLIVLILSCIFIPVKLWKSKQVGNRLTGSTRDFLESERVKLENQIGMLSSVFWWYLLPLSSGIFLFSLGVKVDINGAPIITNGLLVYYMICFIFMVLVYYMNKRSVNKKFIPLLQQINSQIKELDED